MDIKEPEFHGTAVAVGRVEFDRPGSIRTFNTGATRDSDDGKLDYEGFLSPVVLERFAKYMHKNRLMRDGSSRDSDNWQKGIPISAYIKSMFRHFMDLWLLHRGHRGHVEVEIDEVLCAIMFNAMGYLHEVLKDEAE